MKRSRVLLPALTVLALAAAAPAGALTGYGSATALRLAVTTAAAKTSAEQKRTCQAKSGNQKSATSQTFVGTAKKPSVVACEQPPRSQLVTQGLKQAGAAALAAFG
jgi:hypothetical protein